MKKFIFITTEGETKTPTGEYIENLQVLGFGEGIDANHAFADFMKENDFLKTTSFDEVAGIELSNEKQFNFSIK